MSVCQRRGLATLIKFGAILVHNKLEFVVKVRIYGYGIAK